MMCNSSALVKRLSNGVQTSSGWQKMASLLLLVGVFLHVFTCAIAGNSNELSNSIEDGNESSSSASDEQVPAAAVPPSLVNDNYLRQMPSRLRFGWLPRISERYSFYPMKRFREPIFERAPPASFDFKRSSSALDSLTGVTLAGKRSVGVPFAPSARLGSSLVNFEPMLSKHSSLYSKTRPRLYDMERFWSGPYVPYESQSVTQSDYDN